jgi:hypothetical protein
LSASAGAIRAGATYVEIGADTAPLKRQLDGSRADLRRWATDASAQASAATRESLATAAAARQSLGGSFGRALKYGPSSLAAYLSSNRSHVPAGGAIGYGDFGVSPEALIQANLDSARRRQITDLAWAYNRRRGAVTGNIPGMGGAGAFGPGGGFGGGAGDEKRSFLSGGFRGMELFETGMKFATAVGAVKIAIKDAQVFSALFRGDMEGARKAAEELPFGLGTIVKELSGPVDAAMNALVARLSGTWQMGFQVGGNRAEIKAVVDQYNRGVAAIHDVDKALARATLSARELAKQEVDGLKLSAEAASELLAKKLQLVQIDEQKKAEAALTARVARESDAVAQARMDLAKATMTEDEYLEMGVRLLGYSADRTAELLAYRKELLRVQREQKALADQEADRVAIEQAGTQWEIDAENKALDELQRGVAAAKQEAAALTESMQTPEERARSQVEKYQDMFVSGDISGETYNRAVRKALEDAAAAMPEVARQTIGVRGTFNAMEAAGLGSGGIADAMLEAQKQTAKNTEKIAQLAANLGVTFN